MDNYFITLGRQFGSGGHEIGEKLAKALNIKFFDNAIIARAAKESSVTEDVIVQHDEVLPKRGIKRLIKSALFANSNSENMASAEAQFAAIRDISKGLSGVIVGRCADYILHGQENVLKVFICADMEHRVERIMKKRDLDEKEAKKLIEETDKQRGAYYTYHTGQDWGAADNYDLTLNCSTISVDTAVNLIVETIRLLGFED